MTTPLPPGRSAFQQLDASWRVEGGVAQLAEARLRHPLWSATLDGAASLPERRLNLLARLWLETPEARREERAIRIDGPLDAPRVTPVGPAPFKRS
jgi:hypothetical protein